MAGEATEDVEDPWCAGRAAFAVLWVERDRRDDGGCHGPSDLTLDKGLDEHGEEVTAQEAFDARHVLQEDRRDKLDAFQLGAWSWTQARKKASSFLVRGSTVTKRPPAAAMWAMALRLASLVSAT